jgi:DNA-binding transcriptional ArsR family regulator
MAAREKKEKFNPKPIVETFRALSDETRLRILLMLDVRPRSVNEIVDFFTLTQPTISRHLLVLREAGLVRVERHGQKKVYSLNATALKKSCGDYFVMFRSRSAKTGPNDQE